VDNLQRAITDMSVAVEALAIEVPFPVYQDVNTRWQAVITAMNNRYQHIEDELADGD
jgi:hypothetical protein